MKKTTTLFLLVLNFFLTSNYSIGQNDIKKKNFNSIIKISGDTIKSPIIRTNHNESNESQVAFMQEGSVVVLKSNDIISYFDGASMYNSINIKGREEKKLINYIVTGPLYLGRSISKNGKFTYYIKLENDKEMVDLDLEKFDIVNFLKKYLIDFEQFKSTYKKAIYYNFKSLAEFTSAYNAYKDPKTYVAIKYKNPETIKVGFLASINPSQLKFKKDNINTNSTAFTIGVNLTNQFSRSVSLGLLSSLNLASFNYAAEKTKINTFEIAPTLGVSYFLNETLCIKFSAGASILYNLGSKVDLTNEDRSVSIKGLNFGYITGVSVEIKSKYALFINYSGYSFKTQNFDPAGIESKRIGELKSLRIGFYFNL